MKRNFEDKSILKLIFTMGIPPILSMLITSLYGIVDSWYVAKISEEAFLAVSLVFPLQNIVLCVAVGLGVALNGAISRALGRKDYNKVNEISILGIVLTIIHYVVLLVLSLLIITPFIKMNVSDAHTQDLARTYINIISIYSFGVLFQLTFEKMLQGHGSMLIPTIVQIVACLLNISMDHILILELGYGVAGAAVATVVSQGLAAVVLGCYVLFNKKYTISLKHLSFKKENIVEIYKVCIPATLMMCLPNILIVSLNKILISLSEVYVNVLNLYLKVQTFIFMPISGLNQGIRPIIGYFYGSNDTAKIKEVLKKGYLIIISVMVVGVLLFNIIPKQIIQIYFDDPEIIKEGIKAFRIISISFVFAGTSFLLITLYESLGFGFVGLIINILRQFIVTLILAFLLVHVFNVGATGVWISIVVAEVVAAIVGCLMFRYTYSNSPIFMVDNKEMV